MLPSLPQAKWLALEMPGTLYMTHTPAITHDAYEAGTIDDAYTNR